MELLLIGFLFLIGYKLYKMGYYDPEKKEEK